MKFLFLPEGEDPDTYVRKHGKGAFEAALGNSVPLSKFLLDELMGRVDLATAEGRANCIHAAKPLLKQMQANSLRVQLMRELAETCRVSPEEVSQLLDLAPATVKLRAPELGYPRRPPTPLAEQLLQLLVSKPGCVDKLSVEHRALLDSSEFAPVAELADTLKESGATTSAMLVEMTRESRHARLYQDAAARALTDVTDDETAKNILADVLLKLERQRMESEYERLSAGGQRSEVERRRFQEVSRRLDELKKATTGAHTGM